MIKKELIKKIMVKPGKKVDLKDYETGWAQNDESEEGGGGGRQGGRTKDTWSITVRPWPHLRSCFGPMDIHSVLIVLQGMDTAGKDGTIRHVMSGVNPQGCRVTSFKVPSSEELGHNFLWRHSKALPSRGEIGIFNRSYYEDVLVVKVHPEILDAQRSAICETGRQVLGEEIRRHQFLREAPGRERNADPQVLPPHLQGRAEAQVDGPPEGQGEVLEGLPGRP